MDSMTLDGVREEFVTNLKKLQTCLLWRDITEDDTCLGQLKKIDEIVENQVKKVQELKLNFVEEREKLDHQIQMNEALKKCEERLTYMLNNIPERLPRPVREVLDTAKSAREPLAQMTKVQQNQENVGQKVKPALDRLPGKPVNVYVPEIEFLSVVEFEQIPKYQKGRLSYDQINKFIEGCNLAFNSKYKVMKQKKSTMKETDRQRYDEYISQENKDTKGCYFVVDQDLKDFGGLKLDSSARTILTVLRHCGRIKEVRGGNLTRYKYVDSY